MLIFTVRKVIDLLGLQLSAKVSGNGRSGFNIRPPFPDTFPDTRPLIHFPDTFRTLSGHHYFYTKKPPPFSPPFTTPFPVRFLSSFQPPVGPIT